MTAASNEVEFRILKWPRFTQFDEVIQIFSLYLMREVAVVPGLYLIHLTTKMIYVTKIQQLLLAWSE